MEKLVINFRFFKYFVLALAFATIRWIFSFPASLPAICLLTNNAFSASSSASFAFSSSDLVFEPLDLLLLPDDLAMLDLTLFLDDPLEWLLSDLAHDLWSTFFHQKFIFLLKANTSSSTRSNQSPFSICSSSLSMAPYYLCSDISSWNMSLSCDISSSTAIMFLLKKKKSSTMIHFLNNKEYIFCLFSFIKEVWYSKPFLVIFLVLWPLPSSSYIIVSPCWFNLSGKIDESSRARWDL